MASDEPTDETDAVDAVKRDEPAEADTMLDRALAQAKNHPVIVVVVIFVIVIIALGDVSEAFQRIGKGLDKLCGKGCELNMTLQTPEIDGMTVTMNGVVLENKGCTKTTRIAWDWGDGSPSENQFFSAVHVYEAPGQYTVTATAYDGESNVTTASKVITLKAPKAPPPGPTTPKQGGKVTAECPRGPMETSEACMVPDPGMRFLPHTAGFEMLENKDNRKNPNSRNTAELTTITESRICLRAVCYPQTKHGAKVTARIIVDQVQWDSNQGRLPPGIYKVESVDEYGHYKVSIPTTDASKRELCGYQCAEQIIDKAAVKFVNPGGDEAKVLRFMRGQSIGPCTENADRCPNR